MGDGDSGDKICFGSPLVVAAKTYHRFVNKVHKDGSFDCKSKSNSRALCCHLSGLLKWNRSGKREEIN